MFDMMSREELKEFARDNQTGVLILPTMSDTDLRDKLRSWYENQSTAAPAVKSNTSDEFKKLVGDEPTDIGQPGGTEIKKPLSAKERLEQIGKKPTNLSLNRYRSLDICCISHLEGRILPALLFLS